MSIIINRITFCLLITGLCGSLLVKSVQAQSEEQQIRQMLEERDREIKSIIANDTELTEQQRERLRAVVNDVIDFRAMGRTALGPHWDELTQEERDEFIDVFSSIVRDQSLGDMNIYRAEVTYDDISVEGDEAYVITTAIYRDTPTEVAYSMVRQNGEWMVTDIVLDGVSTAEGYARSFQNVIRRRGFEALMTSLNNRLERIRQQAGG